MEEEKFGQVLKCKRADQFNPDTSFVCSEHFTKEDFELNYKVQLVGGPTKKKFKNCDKSKAILIILAIEIHQSCSYSKSEFQKFEILYLKTEVNVEWTQGEPAQLPLTVAKKRPL